LAFAPATRLFLGLPIVKDLDAIGFDCVIGSSDRSGFVAFDTSVIACDPRTGDRTAVVTESKSFRDFCKVGRSADRQARPSGPSFERRIAGGSRQLTVSDFFNFSSKGGLKCKRMVANVAELSN
jgi:hypothetical protein